jgi:hypothetical protein
MSVRLLGLLLVLALPAGCASVTTTSQVDPAAPPTGYARLLVFAPGLDLDQQQRTEQSVVAAATAAGIDIVAYHSVFLPGREYAPEPVLAMLDSMSIGGVLFLRDETTAPATVTTSAMAIPACGSAGSSGGICIPGSSGMVIANSRTQQNEFTIAGTVLDAGDWRVVWISTTRIERKGASDDNVGKALAEDLVEALLNDGVVVATRAGG